jgi:protein SCO1/2
MNYIKKFLLITLILTYSSVAFSNSENTTHKVENAAVIIKKDTSSKKSDSEVKIGGEFTLTDQNGNKFTQENLKGKTSLVFFGFTNCPDECPAILSSLTLALNQIGDKANQFQIVFISVDTKRDDVAKMKEYVSNFNAPIIGLSGTEEQVKKAKDAYKAYSQKLFSDMGVKYNISHSLIIYIMDKNGEFIDHMSGKIKVEDAVKKLTSLN